MIEVTLKLFIALCIAANKPLRTLNKILININKRDLRFKQTHYFRFIPFNRTFISQKKSGIL